MLTNSRSLLALIVGAAVFAILSYLNAGVGAGGTLTAPGPQCCGGVPSKSPVTLDPALFEGPVREAYKLAGKNPALFSQLHCYCGCDVTYGHKNLLDCYRGNHGASCEVCVGEALEASQLAQQGSPVEQIRDALRARYAPMGE
jgi:uncharacterized protein with PCYCGC motif